MTIARREVAFAPLLMALGGLADRVAAVAPAGGLGRAAEAAFAGKATAAVLIARRGRVLWRGAVGSARHGLAAPRIDAAFDVLSIGKTFTAIAVLKLAEQGRIDLNAKIRSYLPELGEALADLKVRHALNGDTGLPVYLDGGDLDPRSAAQALAEIAAIVPERKGGTGYRYSNVNYQLLGLLVERVAGRSFPAALHSLVLAPAGLRRTGLFGIDPLAGEPHATGYVDGKAVGAIADWPYTWSLAGAAGVFSTVDDLYRLNRTFLAGNGLGPQMRARMLLAGAPTYGRGPYLSADTLDISYGAGLFHWIDRAGRHVAFHGGDGDYGFNAVMFWRQEDDVFVCATMNSRWEADPLDRGELMAALLAPLERA